MHNFDWMLWGVEACGILILCVWIAVPIREFKQIAKRLKEKEATETEIRNSNPETRNNPQ